jgi:S-formylglutathione hydrolase FrmB
MGHGVQTILVCVAILAAPMALAKPRCQSYKSILRQEKVKYCIDETSAAASATGPIGIVFFMHGAVGGTEQYNWIGYEKALKKLDATSNLPPLWIVSFKTSGWSFFSDWHGQSGRRQYEKWLMEEFLPFIESQDPRLCRNRDCRGIMGVSMGGFGALKTVLRHPDQFSFAAATNPALLPFDIFADKKTWDEYWHETFIGRTFGRLFMSHLRKIFGNSENFQANNPADIVRNYSPTLPFPDLYFDIVGHDEFGFEKGHQVLRDALDARSLPYEARFFPTAHHIFPHQPQAEAAIEFVTRTLSKHLSR